MNASVLAIVVLCGLGTFALRLVPMWLHRARGGVGAEGTAVGRFLRAIGPASIAALLVVAVWTNVADTGPGRMAGAGLALAVVVAVKRMVGGVAAPTLAAALIYAVWVAKVG